MNSAIFWPSLSVNQILPPGSIAIPQGDEDAVGIVHSVKELVEVVKRPTLLPLSSMNQIFPVESTSIALGLEFPVGIDQEENVALDGTNLSIVLSYQPVNQTFPFASIAIPPGGANALVLQDENVPVEGVYRHRASLFSS